mgnify:CR=1 FL=1
MSPAPYSHKLRVSQLNARRPLALELAPDAEARARIAAHLGLLALPQLRLTATLSPAQNDSWLLEGRLTAQVEQGCVVTLAPVTTTIAQTSSSAIHSVTFHRMLSRSLRTSCAKFSCVGTLASAAASFGSLSLSGY